MRVTDAVNGHVLQAAVLDGVVPDHGQKLGELRLIHEVVAGQTVPQHARAQQQLARPARDVLPDPAVVAGSAVHDRPRAVEELLVDEVVGLAHVDDIEVGLRIEELGADPRQVEALLLHGGKPVSGLVEKLGAGYIRLDIEPEPGRRNVNRLTDDDWERILQVGGVPEELWPTLIDSFRDWTEPDGKPPRTNGAKTDDYYATLTPPYRIRGGPVDTVRELLLVKGFNETILSGGVLNPDAPPEHRKVLSGIQDMLTASDVGSQVNVNAAGLRVLMTLPGVDDLVAHAIIEERERQLSVGANGIPVTGFTSVADFMARIPGLDPTIVSQSATVSTVFRVTSIGQVGQVTRRIWAIVKWDSRRKKLTIQQWREET